MNIFFLFPRVYGSEVSLSVDSNTFLKDMLMLNEI